jgi:predicted nucleic-acid-binding Zn-ribbon protein
LSQIRRKLKALHCVSDVRPAVDPVGLEPALVMSGQQKCPVCDAMNFVTGEVDSLGNIDGCQHIVTTPANVCSGCGYWYFNVAQASDAAIRMREKHQQKVGCDPFPPQIEGEKPVRQRGRRKDLEELLI